MVDGKRYINGTVLRIRAGVLGYGELQDLPQCHFRGLPLRLQSNALRAFILASHPLKLRNQFLYRHEKS
jgi:hypothetical protein